MKCFWLLLISVLLAGCGENSGTSQSAATNAPAKSGTTAADSGTSPLNAPAQYLGGLANAQKSAVKTVDTTSLDKAIEMFNVDQGRNPRDLAELVQKKYIPQVPAAPPGMKLVYDANAGTVRVVPQ